MTKEDARKQIMDAIEPVMAGFNGIDRRMIMAALIEIIVEQAIVNDMPDDAFDYEVAMSRDAFVRRDGPAS